MSSQEDKYSCRRPRIDWRTRTGHCFSLDRHFTFVESGKERGEYGPITVFDFLFLPEDWSPEQELSARAQR
jgi:hypothetical protein